MDVSSLMTPITIGNYSFPVHNCLAFILKVATLQKTKMTDLLSRLQMSHCERCCFIISVWHLSGLLKEVSSWKRNALLAGSLCLQLLGSLD